MRRRLKRWRNLFYAGPSTVWLRPVRHNGYQSPTLTAGLWIYAFIVTYLTLAGRILFICSGLLVLYAMFSLDMPIHLLAFAVLMLFAFDLAAGLLFRPRLTLCRSVPSPVSAGAANTVEYTVFNSGTRHVLDVELDTLPPPMPVKLTRGHAFLPGLAPGQTVRATALLVCERRGRYTLPAMRADSAFPFGLWRWGCTGTGRETILVHPAFTRLQQLRLLTGVRYQSGGIALSSQTGESMEFLGCREFRDGDDPRRLHWRSWARTSYPVVKEFREEYLSRAALVIDTYRPGSILGRAGKWVSREDTVFEAALSLAAAAADHLSTRDYVIDLFAAGPEIYRFQGGRSLAYLENILEILACLEPHRGEPFTELSAALVEEMAHISSAVFILLAWNEARSKLLEDACAAGVTVRAVLVVAEAARKPAGLPDSVTVLSAEDIRAGRCTVV